MFVTLSIRRDAFSGLPGVLLSLWILSGEFVASCSAAVLSVETDLREMGMERLVVQEEEALRVSITQDTVRGE